MGTREKHAAQAIKHMWVRRGEALDNDLHTYNRYGVQLGDKVPLWGWIHGPRPIQSQAVDRQAEAGQEAPAGSWRSKVEDCKLEIEG